MSILFFSKKHQPRKILLKITVILLFFLLILMGSTACSKEINYFDYVSELRRLIDNGSVPPPQND